MRWTRIVTLAGEPDSEAIVAAQLGGREDVALVLRCMDRMELLAAVRGGDLDAVVSIGAPEWLDRGCFEEATRAGVAIIAVASQVEHERLSALGAIPLPVEASIDDIVARARAPVPQEPARLSSQPAAPRGSLIAVWGPKGAPGRTTIAIELAAELAASEPETLLVDGDPYGGDALQLLGIIEELPTIVWASQMAAKDELDAARLATDLRRVGERGPVLLPGLGRAELWAEVGDFGWRQLLAVARATFRFTVCDVGFCLEPDRALVRTSSEGRNTIARSAVAEADAIVAVCRADLIGMKNFLWSLEELRTLTDLEDVFVVANRVRDSNERDISELLRRHIGKRPIAYIPERIGDLARAARAGMPVREVVSGSDVCAGIRTVAAALGGRPASRGLLTRLSGRG